MSRFYSMAVHARVHRVVGVLVSLNRRRPRSQASCRSRDVSRLRRKPRRAGGATMLHRPLMQLICLLLLSTGVGQYTFTRTPVFYSASAAACDESPGTPLSTFAHTMNTDFIDKVTSGRAGQFVPSTGMPAVVRADGSLSIVDASSERFFTYVTDNGWNNQILNLLCALDMARLLNRTLIVPPFAWARRRGDARVSVARLLDLSTLARLGVRVLCEDEHGSVDGLLAPALAAADRSTVTLSGEGQPHRRRGMPRWAREVWVRDHAGSDVGLLRVTCCLFWTWPLPEEIALEMYKLIAYAIPN